jgi:hypothetical protein
VSVRPFKPFLYMTACLLLGATVVGLLKVANVPRLIAMLTGDIGFLVALGWCVWRDTSFRPVAVLASALAVVVGSLALMSAALMALPASPPLVELLFNVFELGYVLDGGGIHGPPVELFVTLWAVSMLGLIGAGLFLGGLLRLFRPAPEPDAQG